MLYLLKINVIYYTVVTITSISTALIHYGCSLMLSNE